MLLGPRIGPKIGPRVGPVLATSTIDLNGLFLGQSANGYGFATNAASGGGVVAVTAPFGRSGGDPGLGFTTSFAACRFNQDSSDAPANPQTYAVHTGTVDLQLYAGAGVPNTGLTQSLGRMLVRHGIARNPLLSVCAIGSSSIPGHWLPGVFPASGEKLYAHLRDFGLARMAEAGRPLDFLWWGIGDSDSGTPARITSMQADATAMLLALRTDWGLPNLPVIMAMIHTDLTPSQQSIDYRAQQVLFKATDVDCTLVDVVSYLNLENYPHFLMGGCADQGDLVGLVLRDRFKPGLNLDLQSGPAPWYQGGAAGYTAQTGVLALATTARPRGYVEPKVGDIEVLFTHGATVTPVITLTTAGGFSALIAQTNSTSGGAQRSLAVWSKTIDQTQLDARTAQPNGIKRGPCATPAVDFGVTATLNFATIHCVRGAAAIETTKVAASNANSTTLVIPGFTTVHNNCFVMIMVNTSGATGQVNSVVNAALVGITSGRNTHQINPGAGFINTEMWYATVPTAGTVVGNTTLTFGASILSVGCLIVFNP